MFSSRLALAALAAGTLALLAASPSWAQDVPRQMVFQGRLVRADGSPESSPQDLRFALYTTPTGGAPVWEESHPAVPVTNGYYAVVIGTAQPLPSSVFTGQPLHLGVSLVGQSELTPRLPIVSVPYALKAGDSEKLGGLGASSFAAADHTHASVPYADNAGDSAKLNGQPASAYATASHTHAAATSTANGFMASADKAKLDALPSNFGPTLTVSGSPAVLNVNLAPSGGANGSSPAAARADHSHATATPSSNGFMAAADKAKLDAQVPVTGVGSGLSLSGGTLSAAVANAGAGLTLSGGTLAANFTPAGGNNGTSSTVARGDHKHAPALACTYRSTSNPGGTGPAVTYCAATEALVGGTCTESNTLGGTVLSGGELVGLTVGASAPQSDGGPGFRCTAASSTNAITATAMCCRVTP